MQAFCTKCGAALQPDARFCTTCGAPVSSAAAPPPSRPMPALPLAIGALLVALGGVAAFFALSKPTDVPRAVPGSPSQPAGAAAGGGDGLPSGHPSIELPKEVVEFLDGLSAEAEKNPQSVEAARKLAHARYRASVINASYRVSAEQALAKLLALDPNDRDGLRISANLAYDAGQFADAEAKFRTYLAKNPDDTGAITDLGSSLLFQDKMDEAVTTYRSAIAKDANFMQAHFNLGIALQKQGKKDDAIVELRRSSELATSPEEKQHIENAIAELEGREPATVAGARNTPAAAPAGAPPKPDGPHAGLKETGGTAPNAGAAAAGGAPSMQGGMPMPPPAPDRPVPTNASSDFQKQAEKPLITHPIVGPRVTGFEWKNETTATVRIADFPMDQMPPFARTKFKTSMGDRLAEVAKTNGVAGPIRVDLVDGASGKVMDTLEVGAAAAAAAPPGHP